MICKDFTERTNKRGHCGPDSEFVLDLSVILPKSYRSGDIIAGGLDTYDWVVVRGVVIDTD